MTGRFSLLPLFPRNPCVLPDEKQDREFLTYYTAPFPEKMIPLTSGAIQVQVKPG